MKNLTKVDFKNKNIFLGIDVHQKQWHVSIVCDNVLTRKEFIANPEKLAEYLMKNYPGANFKAAYEAGCFGYWIKERLDLNNIETIIINPADIPTTDKEKKQKTDKSDSKKIALSLQSQMVRPIFTPDKEQQEDRDLVRRRSDLTKKITRVKNQIKSILKFYGIMYPEEYVNENKHWSKAFKGWLRSLVFSTAKGKNKMESLLKELEFFEAERLIIMRQIRELSRSEKYRGLVNIITSIPGIALLNSMIIITEIMDIRRFKNDNQLCSYLGLSPNENSSGDKRKIGHMTKRCNMRLRTIFIEAAWRAVSVDPALTLYFVGSSKKIGKNKTIVKVAKKLSKRLRHIWLNNCEYVRGVTG